MGKRWLFLWVTELKRRERQRYGGKKKMLLAAGSGAMGWLGKSYFFSDRNTAVRGAEVHSLPLNFPLKKSRIWTAGTWDIWDETFYLVLWIWELAF